MSRAAKETIVKKTPIMYSDFMTNLEKHPASGDIVRVTNVESIKQSLKNLLRINRGDKPFQPSFGSDVNRHLFDTIDSFTLNYIRQNIEDAINQYEKRIQVVKVNVTNSEINTNEVDVSIYFYIINTGESASLSLILKRVR